MIKVITYGTFDYLHYGHIKLLERVKALGDYLIVGVTSDNYDRARGKINVQQSLIKRIKNVEETKLADEIIVEEYEGQKIDDIIKYNIDIFAIGSDWKGKFDYLLNYCKVIYLERTEGISSSELRKKGANIDLGIIGKGSYVDKVIDECKKVNGITIKALFTDNKQDETNYSSEIDIVTNNRKEFTDNIDAVYIYTDPLARADDSLYFLEQGKNVLCQSPVSMDIDTYQVIETTAKDNNLIFMEGLKTAFFTAFNRMLLLAKSGKIGKIVSVDATCTSLRDEIIITDDGKYIGWGSFVKWGTTALLPIFSLLGIDYVDKRIVSKCIDDEKKYDVFTKVDMLYKENVGSIKVGTGVKAEGELIVSGTKGYIYVPAPWWKSEYFEVRFEDQNDNEKYYYQMDGDGTRYMFLAFHNAIIHGDTNYYIDDSITIENVKMMNDFISNNKVSII